MAEANIQLQSLHPGQQFVWDNFILDGICKVLYICAGRRWRKSTLALARAIITAMQGKTVVWGTYSNDLCKEMLLEAKKVCGEVAEYYNSPPYTVTFRNTPNGKPGRIIFKSLEEPDSVRGFTGDGGIVIDEAGFVKEYAYAKCVRPLILGQKDAWIMIIGTPNNYNWFYRGFMRAKQLMESGNKKYGAVQCPTLGMKITENGLEKVDCALENPFITLEEMIDAFNDDSTDIDTFRAEYMAEFIHDSGAVFSNVVENIDSNLKNGATPGVNNYDDTRIYTVGFDVAKKNDFSVITIFDDLGNQVYLKRISQTDLTKQCNMVRDIVADYGGNKTKIYIDSNGMGEMVYETLRNMGMSVVPFAINSNVRKARIVEHLKIQFERSKIKILDIETQTKELLAYEATKLPSGMTRYEAPSSGHDDICMAMALAVWGAINPVKLNVVTRATDDVRMKRYYRYV